MPSHVPALTIAEYQALLTGMPKYCPTAVFTIAGQSLTTPQVGTLITGLLNAALAVPPARTAWLAAVQTSRQLEETDGETVKEVRDVIALMFKNAPTTLTELAIPPKKSPKPLSAEARTAANAKAKATRLARGTTSKKQKALVTGNVTGVNITPITSGTAATTSSSASSAAPPVVGPLVTGVTAGGSTPHT